MVVCEVQLNGIEELVHRCRPRVAPRTHIGLSAVGLHMVPSSVPTVAVG